MTIFKTIARLGAGACIAAVGFTGLGISSASAEGDNESLSSTTYQTTSRTFKDMKHGQDFYNQVNWASENGIAMGYKDGSFKPNKAVTRGEMSAFLYRAAGEPEVKLPKQSPFKDVKTNNGFYEAIIWATSENFVEAYGDRFSPTTAVRRDTMADVLFKYSDAETKAYSDQFKDVDETNQFNNEIAWMKETGLSTGYKDGSFNATHAVTRGQMMTFLFRIHLEPFESVEITKPIKPFDDIQVTKPDVESNI